MAGDVTSMAVALEEDVRELGAAKRLRWSNADNTPEYYISEAGFYDGMAACLETLADKLVSKRTETADSSFFVRQAAVELWSLARGRNWTTGEGLRLATAIQHLMSALQIEARRDS